MRLHEIKKKIKTESPTMLSRYSGSANITGDDNFVSPVGSIPHTQQIKPKKFKSKK